MMQGLSRSLPVFLAASMMQVSVTVMAFAQEGTPLQPRAVRTITIEGREALPALSESVVSETVSSIDETATETIVTESELLSYCMNISDDARELRVAILNDRLTSVGSEIDQKLALLDERIEVLQTWLKKRERFLEMTNEMMVKVYQKMKPDAAALQLMEMDPVLSASLVVKLDPKASSAIMMEMKPQAAARIAELLAAAKDDKPEEENAN